MERGDPQKVLVTGGTGLVGSHLVELLIRHGYQVSCLVRDPGRLRWLTGLNVTLVHGDCSSPASLGPAVRDASIIFHAAGLTKARRAKEYYEVNHLGTRHLLDACARFGRDIKKFILVSSLAAAGPSPEGRPLTDSDRPNPVSDYGRSKQLAEEETLQYRDRIPVVIMRPSAVYGPRDADMFELFRWASRGLWVELAGGDRFINPCFVLDLATALLGAAQKPTRSGNIYFVAEDRAYSWSEFKDVLVSTGGVKARTISLPYWAAYLVALASEAGGLLSSKPALTNRQKIHEAVQKYWLCDLSNIRKDLGFVAEYPLTRGLAITWKWYRENGWL
jgi:nucleoside-diphosphate-sugar epimerase